MRVVTLLLVLLLALPSLSFAVKIKSVDIEPDHPKAGDTVLFTAKTDKNATKVEINFPAVPGPPEQMKPNKSGDKWQIKIKMSKPGKKEFTVTAYDKKGKKDKDDKKFEVAEANVPQPKPQPSPQPAPAPEKQKVGSVSGKLHKNSAAGAALSGVSVSCGGKNATTDGNGNFRLDGVAAGSTTISFSKAGYDSYQTSANIEAGKTASVGDRWLTERVSPVSKSYTPNLNNPVYSNENPFYRSGYWGQCTWFAWGRAAEVTGNRGLPTKNAKEWWDIAQKNFKTGQVPKRNSIIVWGAGKYGHVAYVEDVLDNGNIVLNEANYKPASFGMKGEGYLNQGCPKTLSIGNIKDHYEGFTGYIYLD